MKNQKKLDSQLPYPIADRAPALIAVYNIHTGEYIYTNKAVTKLLGYSPKKFMTEGLPFVSSLVHPQDLPRIMEESNKALVKANKKKHATFQDESIVNFEYRMKHKNGSWRWLHTDGSIFSRDKVGNVECVLNVSVDITKRKTKELASAQKLSESEVRYKAFLSQSSEGIWRFELEKPIAVATSVTKQIQHFYTYAYLAECNDVLARMYGFKHAKQIIGARLSDMLPQDDNNNITYLTNFIRSGYRMTNAISHEVNKNGEEVIFQNNLVGIIENGFLTRAWGSQQDVTLQVKLQERQKFLETVSNKLNVSLDSVITLKEIAKLIVPYLADYCRLVIVDDGHMQEIAVSHTDKNKVALVESLYDAYKDIPKVEYGIPTLLKNGKPELVPAVNETVLKAYMDNAKLMEVIDKLGLKSYMGVPLLARGKVIGAITFSSVSETRRYSGQDLKFAEELAGRIALTVDNIRLYNEAKQSIAVRDDFISIASHELKTPVTSLKIYTQVLEKRLKQKKERELAEMTSKMDRQISKLTNLIEDLLNISRMKAGKLEFKFEEVALNECVAEVIENVQPTAMHHKIIVKGRVKKKVLADRDRLGQVLMNLLTNAIKYSPHAKKVIVTLLDEGNTVRVSVTDFGIGIDKMHHGKIFERFYRVENSDKKKFPGLGIGLYITSEIVKRHKGTMFIESTPGKGSTFSFTLPTL